MPGLNLANVGLVAQGANASQQDFNSLETQRIGLEDLKRSHDTDEAVRQVAAQGGTHEDMALAAEKRGDYQRALQHRQAGKTLDDESIKNVIHKALVDPTPGDRPDLVEEANRYGRTGMKSMSLDDKGNLTFTGSKSGTMNVGVAAERIGLVKPFEKEIPPGGMYVRGNPANPSAPTTVIRNDATPKFELKDGILYNERSGLWQQVDTKGKWTLGKITHGTQEVPVAINSDTGAVNLLGPGGVRTGLDAKITPPTVPGGPTMVAMPGGGVAEFRPSTEATPGTTHVFSPNEPGKPAQPPTLSPAVTDAPPIEGARKAPDGKWYVKSGNGYAEVIPAAGAAPAGTPAATPVAAPAPKAAPKPAAPKPTTPVKAEEEDKLPEVASAQTGPARGVSLERSGINRGAVAAARAEQEKARAEAPKKRAVETFRAIAASPRMTAEDAPLIKEALATGLLTPAEKSKAERMLGKLQPNTAGYADGGVVGKVSRGFEAVGRAFGTDRAKAIERADKAVAPEKKASALERAKSVDEKIETAEKGETAEKYARGGKVTRHGLDGR